MLVQDATSKGLPDLPQARQRASGSLRPGTVPLRSTRASNVFPCPTLCSPKGCSLPGSSVHGIFQTRVLEWGAIAFSAPCHQASQIPEGTAFPSVFIQSPGLCFDQLLGHKSRTRGSGESVAGGGGHHQRWGSVPPGGVPWASAKLGRGKWNPRIQVSPRH